VLNVFDLKTGSATLTSQRILQIQQQVGSAVPVNLPTMKKKDFEKIGRALLPEFADFRLHGQTLFLEPIRHTLRGLFLDRSVNNRGFYVQVFVQPLFVPAKHIGFNFGWRLGGPSHLWNADAPRLIDELGSAIRDEALPFLRRIESPRDVADAARQLNKSADPHVQQAVAYSLTRAGDVDGALREIGKLIALLDRTIPWQAEMVERAEGLKSQLLKDLNCANRMLEQWEAETVVNLGIENLGHPRGDAFGGANKRRERRVK